MGELSDQQRLFCREVAKGTSPKLAYLKAFDCKESAASACACRMLKRANVQSEISRLRARGREVARERVEQARDEGRELRTLWDKAKRAERLQEWAERCAEAGEIGAAIRCVDLLNKMDGAYEVAPVEQGAEAGVVEFRRAILAGTSGLPMVKKDV